MAVRVHRSRADGKTILGIDLDNTLICYDGLFHKLAVEQRLIDPMTPANKRVIRDTLRAKGLETQWTRLQGEAYGARILEATVFPGAIGALIALHRAGIGLRVVSHKTRYPALGPQTDLRRAALRWLIRKGILNPSQTGLGPSEVFFEDSPTAKRQRIAALGCTDFVDDLPELLLHPSFPRSVTRTLFDPSGELVRSPSPTGSEPHRTATHWNQIREHFLLINKAREAAGSRYSPLA
ncbi:MAG: hypothetical protein ACI9QQ_000166 [Myxococcota bacterium]|jgi:hypothetical protein